MGWRCIAARSGGCCARLGLPTKDLQVAEQKRPELAAARHIWITKRQPFMAKMLTRIGFMDETSVKTNMAKTTGWGRAASVWSTTRPSATGTPRPSSRPCATTASTYSG